MSSLAGGHGPLFIAPVNLLHGNHVVPPPAGAESSSPVVYALIVVALVLVVAVAVVVRRASRRNSARPVRHPDQSAVAGRSATA